MANGKRSGNNKDKEAVMVGAGLAALAAGAYFFLGPKGNKHQRQMKGWMVKMKGEVLEKLEEAKNVTEPLYNEIVDTAARTNAVAGKIPKSEIALLARDLKKQWKTLSRSFKGQGTGGARRRAARKTNKNTKRGASRSSVTSRRSITK